MERNRTKKEEWKENCFSFYFLQFNFIATFFLFFLIWIVCTSNILCILFLFIEKLEDLNFFNLELQSITEKKKFEVRKMNENSKISTNVLLDDIRQIIHFFSTFYFLILFLFYLVLSFFFLFKFKILITGSAILFVLVRRIIARIDLFYQVIFGF